MAIELTERKKASKENGVEKKGDAQPCHPLFERQCAPETTNLARVAMFDFRRLRCAGDPLSPIRTGKFHGLFNMRRSRTKIGIDTATPAICKDCGHLKYGTHRAQVGPADLTIQSCQHGPRRHSLKRTAQSVAHEHTYLATTNDLLRQRFVHRLQ